MRRALVLVCLGIAVAGCGGATKTSSLPSTPATATAVPGLAVGDAGALRSRLVPLPTGATALTIADAPDGTMDLDHYMAYGYSHDSASVQATERAQLSSYGFRTSALRSWRTDEGVLVSSVLMEFSDADGAGKQNQGQDAGYANGTTYTLLDTIDGVDGEAFASTAADANGYFRTVAIARVDNIWLEESVLRKGAAASAATAETVLTDQVHALEQSGGVSPTSS